MVAYRDDGSGPTVIDSQVGVQTTAWNLPAGVTSRSTATGDGSGHMTAALADSNGPVSQGAQGGLTATTDASGSAGITFSVLLGP